MNQQLRTQSHELPPKQQAVATLKAVETLYQNGQTVEALEVSLMLAHQGLVQAAWCHYRLKQYPECAATLAKTPDSPGSLELWAYLYAYEFTGFKNEQKLEEIVSKLSPDNVNAHNALVIAARDKNSNLDAAQIFAKLEPWISGLDRSLATEKDANLLHNLARLALAKDLVPDHLQKALELIEYAIEAYGTESKRYHRGAAHYWRSVILETMDYPFLAWQASVYSLQAWSQQLDQEPSNPEWQKRVEAAQLRERELASKAYR